jgi:D-methionine transport system ATP-binding protein
MILIKDLCKRFDSLSVLENVNLSIEKGEIFGVIGKSGAGKSTLVRCINYLERPTAGEIIFDGSSLSSLTPPQLYEIRKSMGMVFQQFNLMMQRTALDNVCFPLRIAGRSKQEARKRATELLELVGMPDKAGAYPAQLSGGQRQRVAIARAIALNPKALLCDEATSALDPETTRGILALLRSINEEFGITIVVITHEMHVVETICRRVAILDSSRVAETGTVTDVFSNPKSPAARKLVYPEDELAGSRTGDKRCRIVFDGVSSFEPLISDMVLHFRRRVNILFADTRNINGTAYGQMVVQLPEDDEVAGRMMEYIRAKGLKAEEVAEDV